MDILIFCLIIFCIFLVLKTAVVVPAREVAIKEHFGKYAGTLEPGLHILIPFVDRIAYRHEMREQVVDIPTQTCITRDNIQVEVSGDLYIKVVDAFKASYGISNYLTDSIHLAQTTMRSQIGKMDLDAAFSERESVNENIIAEIDKASEPWGVKVLRYEIEEIRPSRNVISTLEQQMEAERKRRAEVTLAEAERISVQNVAIGERQEQINLSEGERQRTKNAAEGRARAIEILATASAEGIAQVATAIQRPGGDRAVKMQLVEQFIDEFGRILSQANLTVMPSDAAQLKTFFEGVSKVSEPVRHPATIKGTR